MAKRRCRAFTLIELLVVIGIIALLIGILIPTVRHVQASAHAASTRSFLSGLQSAIERYQGDHHAYPGPFSNLQVENTSPAGVTLIAGNPPFSGSLVFAPSAAAGYANAPLGQDQITASENLVLGLLGGLRVDTSSNPPKLVYDPTLIGTGPRSLNTAGPPVQSNAYIEATNLSWRMVGDKKTGQYADGAGSALDSVIPEFVDSYPQPMPVIYLRARAGQAMIPPTAPGYGPDRNGIITYDKSDPNNRVGQYDLHDLRPYTSNPIGEGKSVRSSDYVGGIKWPNHGLQTIDVNGSLDKSAAAPKKYSFPYDAFPYFSNPAVANTPRAKDGYILISAGPDRVYGTSDDICSFGSVLQ